MARTQPRRSQSKVVRTLRVTEALRTWVIPTAAGTVVAVTVLLSALDLVPSNIAAAITVLALLVIAAHTALAARLRDDSPHAPISRPVLALIGIAWTCLLYYPFHCRLFPGSPLSSVSLEPGAPAGSLSAGGRGRLDLVLDAHLPATGQRTNRSLRYDFDLVDERGTRARVEGDLGDRWQTRRLGRRGTTQAHIEHLSTLQTLPMSGPGLLRIENVNLTGVPGATLTATLVPHRTPGRPWLLTVGMVLSAVALAADLGWDPDATPVAAFLTATGTAAAVIFADSGSGHAGVRDVIGAVLAGGIIGVPSAAAVAAIARRAFADRLWPRGARKH